MSISLKNPEWLRRLPHYIYLQHLYSGSPLTELDCRAGVRAEFLAQHGAEHVTAIDPSHGLIEEATQKYTLHNLEFHCADYKQTTFIDRSFDCIFAPLGL